jgi:hypothetical protein
MAGDSPAGFGRKFCAKTRSARRYMEAMFAPRVLSQPNSKRQRVAQTACSERRRATCGEPSRTVAGEPARPRAVNAAQLGARTRRNEPIQSHAKPRFRTANEVFRSDRRSAITKRTHRRKKNCTGRRNLRFCLGIREFCSKTRGKYDVTGRQNGHNSKPGRSL